MKIHLSLIVIVTTARLASKPTHMTAELQKVLFRWRDAPLFVVAWSFVAGMTSSTYLDIPSAAWLTSFGLVLILTLLTDKRKSPGYKTTLILLIGFTLGASIMSRYMRLCQTTSYSQHISGEVLDISNYSNGVKATIRPMGPSSVFQPRIMAYIRNPETRISPGDEVHFTGKVHKIEEPQYAFQFDTRRFLQSQGIWFRVFLNGDSVEQLKEQPTSWIRRRPFELRQHFVSLLDNSISDSTSAGILKAICLGDKSFLSPDIRKTYVKAGAMHILAISGLHIGIVVSILVAIIGLPRAHDKLIISTSRFALINGILWAYILLCGVPPSAARAAFMFTIYCTGMTLSRKPSTLNMLGFTALVFLISSPYMLFNISFQFSYLALTGILLWGLPIMKSVPIKNRVLHYAWSILSISIGAQVLLIPAMIFYFGSISVIGPVTSLIAIPAAFVMVISGLSIIIAALISPPVGQFLGGLVEWFMQWFNAAIGLISQSSFSVIQFDRISPGVMLVLILLLLLMTLRLHTNWLLAKHACIPLALLLIVLHLRDYVAVTQSVVLTYFTDQPKPAFDIHSGGLCLTTFDPSQHDKYRIAEQARNCHDHYCRKRISIPELLDPHQKYVLTVERKESSSDLMLNLSKLPFKLELK